MTEDTTDAAHVLFPSDAPSTEQPQRGSEQGSIPTEPTPESVLFKDEDQPNYDEIVGSELGQHLLDAIKDGDTDRTDALNHATAALAGDLREHGTDAAEFQDALHLIRQSAGVVPPNRRGVEASFAEGMATLQAEGVSDGDLTAARQFIADLEARSPGVVASLEAHGAGNDPRLVRAAIKEARRRGY